MFRIKNLMNILYLVQIIEYNISVNMSDLEQDQQIIDEDDEEEFSDLQHPQLQQQQQSNQDLSHDSEKYKNIFFRFPVFVTQRNTFASLEQINQLIRIQQQSNPLQYAKIFKVIRKSAYIYYNCKKCNAKLSMFQIQNSVVITKYNIDHVHQVQLYSKQQVQKYFSDNRHKFNDPTFKQQVQKLYKIPRRKYYYLLKKYEEDFYNSDALIKYFQRNSYNYKSQRKTAEDPIPTFILAVNQTMKRNYKQFGDILYFDIFPSLMTNPSNIPNQIMVAIFSGEDHRRKTVIFGICYLLQQKSFLLYSKIMKQFFKIVFQYPDVIITRDNQLLTKAVQDPVNFKLYKGVHLLNIDQPIEDITNIIKQLQIDHKSDNWIANILRKIKIIMRQNDFQIGKQLLVQIAEYFRQPHQSPQIQKIIQKFLQKIQMICLWKTPCIFSGLSRYYNDIPKLSQILKQKLQKPYIYRLNINRLFQILDNFSEQMNRTSFYPLHCTDNSLQSLYRDRKLKATRLKFQSKVFSVFFENYIQARQHNTVNKAYNKRNGYEILNNKTGQIYKVQRWICNCLFLNKTGIPCSHLISILLNRLEQKQYYELFHKRWFSRKDSNQGQTVEQRIDNRKHPKINMKFKYAQ